MAKGVINLQKESGGIIKISPADGTGVTEVIIPESGELANKDYADGKISKTEVAYNVNTSSFIPNTLASGAILERGSNANGEYVKFADGTLICNADLGNEVGYSWPNGTWFHTSNFPLAINGWTYPSAFSAKPNVHITSLNDNGSSAATESVLTEFYTTSNTKAYFQGKATGNIVRVIFVRVMAIGKWK